MTVYDFAAGKALMTVTLGNPENLTYRRVYYNCGKSLTRCLLITGRITPMISLFISLHIDMTSSIMPKISLLYRKMIFERFD